MTPMGLQNLMHGGGHINLSKPVQERAWSQSNNGTTKLSSELLRSALLRLLPHRAVLTQEVGENRAGGVGMIEGFRKGGGIGSGPPDFSIYQGYQGHKKIESHYVKWIK